MTERRVNDALEQAAFHLSLIKKRLLSIRQAVARLSVTSLSFDYILTLDYAFLDVRKVIEELMLLSLCAHEFAQIELSNKMRREWNAERLMRYLERVNPRFFPDGIETVETEEEGIAGQFVTTSRPCLTKGEAADIYNFCGSVLHASNMPLQPDRVRHRYARLVEFAEKACGLLDTFEIDLTGNGWVICGHLHIDRPDIPPDLFNGPVFREVAQGRAT
ncbi:hypothetical protein [Rhizobium miluonense]|uniref:Uncharacterized protein n=1 Tax=Rhizobium miluonense TaxID=411945 RepID=A0ABU1SYN6_9HYPH|nr:hypothetical protein [Rhizobium miluonense]MDR6904072.1 hypothetical protein [Rhizobium miluonense]